MKYVLHIGPHKTGSSYIQMECAQRRQELLDHHIVYPLTWNREAFAHDDVYHQLIRRDYEFFSENFEKLEREVTPDVRAVLISAENMEYLDGEAIRVLSKHFTPENTLIVYYARSWPALLRSTWQENVKSGSIESFPEFSLKNLVNPLQSPILNFEITLSKFAGVYRPENVLVRSYDNLMNSGVNVFEDLISVIFGCPLNIQGRGIVENQSMPPLDVEIVRLLNRLVLGDSHDIKAYTVMDGFLKFRSDYPGNELLWEQLRIAAAPYRRSFLLEGDLPSFRIVEKRILSSFPNATSSTKSGVLFDELRSVEIDYYSGDLMMGESGNIVKQIAREIQRQHISAYDHQGPSFVAFEEKREDQEGQERGACATTPNIGENVLEAGGHGGDLLEFVPFVPVEPLALELPISRLSKVALVGEAIGFFPDGWVRPIAKFSCRAFDVIRSMSLEIWSPPGPVPLTVTLVGAGNKTTALPAESAMTSILQFAVTALESEEFVVELQADQERQLSETDTRHASYILRKISFA